jgi:hypothetical protein
MTFTGRSPPMAGAPPEPAAPPVAAPPEPVLPVAVVVEAFDDEHASVKTARSMNARRTAPPYARRLREVKDGSRSMPLSPRAGGRYRGLMPDSTVLKLDLYTEQQLVGYIDHDTALGRFQLGHDRLFVLDTEGGDPGRSDLVRTLKEKLGFVDFEAGGLKMGEIDVKGHPARFTLVPRWDSPPPGVKGFGGPSIALQFTLHF